LKKYVKIFLISGTIIGLMSLLAKYSNPTYSAIIYAIPIEFMTIILFLQKDKQIELINNSSKSTLILLTFFIVLNLLLLFLTPIISLILSTIIFMVLGFIFVKRKTKC